MSATGTFTAAEAVELAVVERSGFVESRHVGSAVVIAPDGAVVQRLGSPESPVFPRSSLKPFQALAVLNAGVPLREEQAALATASHSGTPRHASVVRAMLASAALSEEALQCPADWPLDRRARDEAVAAGLGPSRVFMNCSGKHAAMLLACVANGWPASDATPAKTLQERRAALLREAGVADARLADIRSTRSSGSDDDEHDPEGETLSAQWSQAEGLRAGLAHELAELDRALERVAAGTYGTCARCGRPIGADRLAARPTAELCIDCARAAEARR